MDTRYKIELAEKTPAQSLLYADSPLNLGGIAREITIEELVKKSGKQFTYSDSIYSKNINSPYLPTNPTTKIQTPTEIENNFSRLGFSNTTNFVICDMNELGLGVFANKDFEANECFILYSGVIDSERELGQNRDYAFQYNRQYILNIDALEIGNFSRFIQHMPLKKDPKLTVPKEALDYWEYEQLELKNGLKQNDIAWSNLTILTVPEKGVPQLILYNKDPIKKGDQLGISYGGGYWIRRNKRPELFDLNGGVIPLDRYRFKQVYISLPPIEQFRLAPNFDNIAVNSSYSAEMFTQDLGRREEFLKPVWFSHMAEPVSIFKLRELLLTFNVIGKEYKSVESNFINELRDILPKEFDIKVYERNPGASTSRRVYDVVCYTDELMKWAQLTAFLKSPLIKMSYGNTQNICLKLTQEVILMNIDLNSSNLARLLSMTKFAETFDTPMDESLFPTGPKRRDPNNIAKINTKEAIKQVLRHNPDLKEQDIHDSYALLESAFTRLILPASLTPQIQNQTIFTPTYHLENRLSQATLSFFNSSPPAQWKPYPKDRLQGKYIGHDVRYFTLPPQHSSKADNFTDKLKQAGLDSEVKKAGEKSSIVVDMTNSLRH